VERILAGAEETGYQPPGRISAEPGDEPGPHERRLAAAGCPEEEGEAAFGERLDLPERIEAPGDLPVTAEEDRGIRFLEGGETGVGRTCGVPAEGVIDAGFEEAAREALVGVLVVAGHVDHLRVLEQRRQLTRGDLDREQALAQRAGLGELGEAP
jgi:hypothetical protein